MPGSPHRLDGLGHFPFTEATGIRIPLGVIFIYIFNNFIYIRDGRI